MNECFIMLYYVVLPYALIEWVVILVIVLPKFNLLHTKCKALIGQKSQIVVTGKPQKTIY